VTNVFVGNLDITVTEQQLRELFAAHGAVETITIVKDRDTGERRGNFAWPLAPCLSQALSNDTVDGGIKYQSDMRS
jgi:hypothetical protein